MAANTTPIFPDTPNVDWPATPIATANTARDGTGTVLTVFTAGADGAIIERIRGVPVGTNVATVLRLFINNGSSNATPANNTLNHEQTCPATTASEVAALALIDIIFPLPLKLDPGFKINATVGTTIAAGIALTSHGGDY